MRLRVLLATLAAAAALASPAAAVTFTVTNSGATNFLIDGQPDPTLQLTRGETYTFNVNAPGHPFWIKTAQVTGTGSAYNTGVTNNGTDSGAITFTVPEAAPATLFYNCQFHAPMTGTFEIVDPVPAVPTWGLAGIAMLAGGLGLLVLRRRIERLD